VPDSNHTVDLFFRQRLLKIGQLADATPDFDPLTLHHRDTG
jgi:hypothetical protein